MARSEASFRRPWRRHLLIRGIPESALSRDCRRQVEADCRANAILLLAGGPCCRLRWQHGSQPGDKSAVSIPHLRPTNQNKPGTHGMEGKDGSRGFAPGLKLGAYEITHAVWSPFRRRGPLGAAALETFGANRHNKHTISPRWHPHWSKRVPAEAATLLPGVNKGSSPCADRASLRRQPAWP